MTAQPSSQAEREDVALRACPFCDQPTGEMDQFHPTLRNEWRVICTTCDAWGPERRTEATAKAAWNTRPDREHATPRSMPEEVVEAYERAAKVADQEATKWAQMPRYGCPGASAQYRVQADTARSVAATIRALIPGASA